MIAQRPQISRRSFIAQCRRRNGGQWSAPGEAHGITGKRADTRPRGRPTQSRMITRIIRTSATGDATALITEDHQGHPGFEKHS